ncbi:hypothetical protein BBta_6990 [Bradyrhizobium sp. BTAi1]|nr:hypothetical protein BBta_6990 [Bradyrhizobium sp. BTAi1]
MAVTLDLKVDGAWTSALLQSAEAEL